MNQRSVLFVQGTDPAIYPPLINAGWLLAEAGYAPVYLSSPHAENRLIMPSIPGMALEELPARPSYIMGKLAYARYVARAISLARSLRPIAIYASDPLGALPGLLAARASGATLIYHEHDSPTRVGDLNPVVRRARAAAGRTARLVVFPNAQRAARCSADLGLSADRLAVIWNVPRRAEIPASSSRQTGRFTLHYHGSINRERLPMAVAEAATRFGGRVVLRIAGYTTGSGEALLAEMIARYGAAAQGGVIDYVGQVSRETLLELAASADAGLALMPTRSDDVNMTEMVGASNKAFDYMAAGLPLIVSDLPAWRSMYVDPGYGLTVDPDDPESLTTAVSRLLDDPERSRRMGGDNRRKIAQHWNYDIQFRPVVELLQNLR